MPLYKTEVISKSGFGKNPWENLIPIHILCIYGYSIYCTDKKCKSKK